MKTNRRTFISTAITGGMATTAIPFTSCRSEQYTSGIPTELAARYATLDEILKKPVLKSELIVINIFKRMISKSINRITCSSPSLRLIHYLSFLTTLAVIVFLVFPQFNNTILAQDTDYDVVVIAGTPAGVAAAIAAGRMGKTVIIIEQSPVLGGMLASRMLLRLKTQLDSDN